MDFIKELKFQYGKIYQLLEESCISQDKKVELLKAIDDIITIELRKDGNSYANAHTIQNAVDQISKYLNDHNDDFALGIFKAIEIIEENTGVKYEGEIDPL